MNNISSLKILRQFGLLVGLLFPILIGWIIPSIGGHPFRVWTLFFGVPALILGIFNPKLLQKPYFLWIKLGYFLGWINSRLILGIVFLIVLQPIALFMRIFGYDPLRKKKSNKNTYREITKNNIIDYKRIF